MSPKSDPSAGFIPVTPSDTVDIRKGSRALYIGESGNLVVRARDSDTNVTFVAVPVGVLPISVDRVLSASTTAASIVALY